MSYRDMYDPSDTYDVEDLLSIVETLQKEVERLRKERDEALSKNEAHRMIDHCCCRFEADGETQKSWCSIHAALRDEAERLRAERDAG